MLSAEDGRKTLLYRRQDKPAPHAKNQRNQAWHQFGFNDSFGPDISLARLMRQAGKVLLDEFRLAAPAPGFMRLAARNARVVEERARALGDGPVAMYYESFYDQCNDGEILEEES